LGRVWRRKGLTIVVFLVTLVAIINFEKVSLDKRVEQIELEQEVQDRYPAIVYINQENAADYEIPGSSIVYSPAVDEYCVTTEDTLYIIDRSLLAFSEDDTDGIRFDENEAPIFWASVGVISVALKVEARFRGITFKGVY